MTTKEGREKTNEIEGLAENKGDKHMIKWKLCEKLSHIETSEVSQARIKQEEKSEHNNLRTDNKGDRDTITVRRTDWVLSSSFALEMKNYIPIRRAKPFYYHPLTCGIKYKFILG